MFSKSILLAGVVIGTLSLSACGQGHAPGAQGNPAAPAAQPSDVAGPSPAPGVAAITVVPGVVDGCESAQPIVATVKWHSAVQKVKVMVSGPSDPTPRLFSESGYNGSAKTGNWVTAGTKFELINAVSGAVLASSVVSSTRCGSFTTVRVLRAYPFSALDR